MVPKLLPPELLYETALFLAIDDEVPNDFALCRMLHNFMLPRAVNWAEICLSDGLSGRLKGCKECDETAISSICETFEAQLALSGDNRRRLDKHQRGRLPYANMFCFLNGNKQVVVVCDHPPQAVQFLCNELQLIFYPAPSPVENDSPPQGHSKEVDTEQKRTNEKPAVAQQQNGNKESAQLAQQQQEGGTIRVILTSLIVTMSLMTCAGIAGICYFGAKLLKGN